jgi:hypothetical protein
MFILVCFNIFHRQKMLQSASWRVMSQGSDKIAELTGEEVSVELERRNSNNYGRHHHDEASKFISLINCMTRALPHTEAASKKGRGDILSMQVALGVPQIFFTASPPDNNSMIICVYGGIQCQNLPKEITEEYLKEKCKERSILRFKYPGLSTLNFEIILDILLREVVGWNPGLSGYFGKPKAHFYSVEEQSRKTLHVHMLIWLHDDPLLVNMIENAGNKRIQKALLLESASYIDKTQSCFINGDEVSGLKCECSSTSKRMDPEIQSNQMLRFLRHEEGCRVLEGGVAFCPKCDKTWTSNELSYNSGLQAQHELVVLREPNDLDELKTSEKLQKMMAEEIVFRSKAHGNKTKIPHLANALYNNHSSLHVRTCFKEKCSECRYKFPKASNKRTRVEFSEEEYDWFSYRGSSKKRRMMDVVLKRGTFDVCSNTYCPAISNSKAACNTNVSGIVNGVQAFYMCKYASKNTQKEDCSDYEFMNRYVTKRLSKTNFETPGSEALSRVVGACLAHNSRNVISATMAKYLINNTSRFGLSHSVQHVPINELRNILNSVPIMLRLSQQPNSDGGEEKKRSNFFVEGPALQYLC